MAAALVLRLPVAPRRLQALAVSLALHALVLALLAASWGGARRVESTLADALPVEIVAAPPPAPPAAPAAAASRAAPEPEPEPRTPPEPEAPPPEPERPRSRKKPPEPRTPAPAPRPAPAAGETETPTGAERSAPAGGAAASGPREGSSIESLDLLGMGQRWYRDAVVAALSRAWVRPILEGVRQTLEVTVAFEIERSGSVSRVRVVASSGVPTLDRSAVRAVYDAAPLPPLPPGWRASRVPARFVFRLHPQELP